MFDVYPRSNNIPHSLIKEPKIYLCDWSSIQNPGARLENFVACHLKKAVDFWTEQGFGEFGLYFLRDKNGKEVDFLVERDGAPWFIVEVKTSKQRLSSAIEYFMEKTKAPFAFQVTKEMEHIDYDCFSKEGAFIVPLSTFLSQLP